MNDRDQRGHIFIGHWLLHFYADEVLQWTNKAADLMVRLQDHVTGAMAECLPEDAAPSDEAAPASEAGAGRDESFTENAAASEQAAPTPDDEPGHRSSDGGDIPDYVADAFREVQDLERTTEPMIREWERSAEHIEGGGAKKASPPTVTLLEAMALAGIPTAPVDKRDRP